MTNKKQDAFQVSVDRCTMGYGCAIAEIERLESELKLTKNALGESLAIQKLMGESLIKYTAMLHGIEYQLKNAEMELIHSNKRVIECVDGLRQENKTLRLLSDLWLNRSINLKFELLMANDTINKIKAGSGRLG
ncbi:MAG: hypothetical protein Q8N96_09105 [Methylovulum sp.]|nr:hypothetical protein [Methylovulum sp.]